MNLLDTEQAVLGAVLGCPEAWWQVADVLSADDFTHPSHRLIWQAIAESVKAGRPYDAFTLADWFAARGELEAIGNGAYLVGLSGAAANVEAYAALVADKSKRRRLLAAMQGAMQAAMGDVDTDALIGEVQRDLSLLTGNRRERLKDVTDGLREMVDAMQRRFDGGDIAGTSYGLPAMDYMTGGKKPGELIIVAARPSMGKTTLALQGALLTPRPLIFSFETKADALLARMTAHVGRFPLKWITQPKEAPEEAMSRVLAASKLVREQMRGLIYDGRRLTFDQMRAIAIREHSKQPLTEIVTDHLGHVRTEGRGRLDVEQGEITKGHKELARELDLPAVLLMQLNRGVEQRADRRPMLSDLRECGAAEEDADVVAMIYRDEYYNRDPRNPLKGFSEIFLRKNRDGELGECWAHARLEEMRFEQAEPQQRSIGEPAKAGGPGGGASGIRSRSQPRPLSVVGGGD